jgi:hypothetical protein
VLSILTCVLQKKAQDCNFPPKALPQGEHRAYKVTSENKAYGYFVLIPEHLAGYDYVNPFYEHGFGIVPREESKSCILVHGEKNSLELACSTDACIQGGSFVE